MASGSARRPTSMAGALQATALFGSCVLLASLVIGELIQGLLVGSMAFLIWRYGVVRQVLCHHLRQGSILARAGRHQDALKAFGRSATVWEGRRGIDDLRGILLGSASRWPFRHLSRYNAAWCMARLGHADQARAAVQALLVEAPTMTPALELLHSLDPAAAAAAALSADTRPADDWQDLLHDEPSLEPRDHSE